MVKSPQLLVKSSEIIEIWLSSACCSCFARAQCLWVLSSRRKQLRRPRFDLWCATWCDLRWPEKAQEDIYKTYEIIWECGLSGIFRFEFLLLATSCQIHWTLSKSKQVYIKHEVTGVWSHWSACTGSSSWGDPAWEALFRKFWSISNSKKQYQWSMNHVWKGEFIPALRELRVS